MCSGLEDENSKYPYHIHSFNPPISVLKVLPLEVAVSNDNVLSPVAMGAAGCRGPIGSVCNNCDVWSLLLLMSLQSKSFAILGIL